MSDVVAGARPEARRRTVLAGAFAVLTCAGANCGGMVATGSRARGDGADASTDAERASADAARGRTSLSEWSVAFEASQVFGFCVASSGGGAVAVAMETTSTTGEEDPFQLEVRYYDAYGVQRWARTIADRPEPFAQFTPVCSLAFDGEDVVLAARRERDDTQNAPLRGFFARLAAGDGAMLWSATLGNAEMVQLTPVLLVDGTLFVAGTTMGGTTGLPNEPSSPTNAEAFLVAYDATTGAIERSVTWSATVPQTTFESLGLRPDGDLSLVGSFAGSVELKDTHGSTLGLSTTAENGAGFLARYSTDFSLRALVSLGPPVEPLFGKVAFDASGAFVAASSSVQITIARCDADGHVLSTVSVDDPEGPDRNIDALAVVSTGEAIVPFGDGVAAFGPTGASVDRRSYPGALFGAFAPTTDGKLIAAGELSSAVNFGSGELVPAPAVPARTTIFVARGHLW